MAKYFTEAETKGLKPFLIYRLDALREEAGIPVVITEGVPASTTGSHVADSEHFTGLGVDIRCADSNTRFKLLKAAFKVGFTRIGVYDKHIHVGVSLALPTEVTWVGVSK
jgi:zinc D-Ala-D-Ala carboxypeptidase